MICGYLDGGCRYSRTTWRTSSTVGTPPEVGDGYNWGGYSNSEFDKLALGLLSETTIDGARDKIFQLQEFLAEELPYVTLFTTPKLDAYRPSRIEFPYTSVLGGLEQQNGMQQEVLIK